MAPSKEDQIVNLIWHLNELGSKYRVALSRHYGAEVTRLLHEIERDRREIKRLENEIRNQLDSPVNP